MSATCFQSPLHQSCPTTHEILDYLVPKINKSNVKDTFDAKKKKKKTWVIVDCKG